MQVSGGKRYWQRKQPVQRSWGRSVAVACKERQGSQESGGEKETPRGDGQDPVGHSEHSGLYAE